MHRVQNILQAETECARLLLCGSSNLKISHGREFRLDGRKVVMRPKRRIKIHQ